MIVFGVHSVGLILSRANIKICVRDLPLNPFGLGRNQISAVDI